MKDKEKAALMGTLVTVTHGIRAAWNEEKQTTEWTPYNLPRNRSGWVVGFRNLQNGIYHEGHASGPDGDDYEQAYLEVTSIVPVAQVCFWPSMKPVLAPMFGFLKVIGYPR